MIDHFRQAYSWMRVLMDKTNHGEERRNARRFQVRWEVAVKGTDRAGWDFEETGRLEDLSSRGALLSLPIKVDIGARFELRIKVPFKRDNRMKYAVAVVRLEQTKSGSEIGVRFDTALPVFVGR